MALPEQMSEPPCTSVAPHPTSAGKSKPLPQHAAWLRQRRGMLVCQRVDVIFDHASVHSAQPNMLHKQQTIIFQAGHKDAFLWESDYRLRTCAGDGLGPPSSTVPFRLHICPFSAMNCSCRLLCGPVLLSGLASGNPVSKRPRTFTLAGISPFTGALPLICTLDWL